MQPFRPFIVAEASMRPALEPGDGLLTVPLRRPRPGRLCVVEHPHRPGFWLVKRIAGVPGDVVSIEGRDWTVRHGELFVLSDDRSVTRADSRTWGPVPATDAWRVVVRVPARFLGRTR